MKENKAREFWVDPESMDDDVGIYDTFDKHPGQGPLQWQASLIHVIEKSAYQKAVDALKEIAKDRYEANPWTVVSTAAAKKAEEVLKELGELG